MKLLFSLVILLSIFQTNAQLERVRFGIVPEVNHSFIGEKNINDDSFKKLPSVGFGVTFPAFFSFANDNTFIVGLKAGFNTYNFNIGSVNQVSQYMGLSLPISFERKFSDKWLLGFGTELSWRKEYLNTFNQFNQSDDLMTSVVFHGKSLISIPLRVYAGRSFISKKQRRSDLLLSFSKSFQQHEAVTLLNLDGGVPKSSSFSFRNTYLSVGYRFYFGKVQ